MTKTNRPRRNTTPRVIGQQFSLQAMQDTIRRAEQAEREAAKAR
jgi:hypothetical protein